jgi:hypothetical protein
MVCNNAMRHGGIDDIFFFWRLKSYGVVCWFFDI